MCRETFRRERTVEPLLKKSMWNQDNAAQKTQCTSLRRRADFKQRSHPMSKRELIDAILQHNRTASPEFLARFAESDLKAYLDRMSMIAMTSMKDRVQTGVGAQQA